MEAQKKDISKIEKIAVHDGVFHSDDVFAVGALLYANPNLKIFRTRNPKVLDSVDLRVDVGFKYNPETGDYDHHQGAGKRENGVPYAAFGLIWKDYGKEICTSVMKDASICAEFLQLSNSLDINKVSDSVEKRLVQPIDSYDNGRKPKVMKEDTTELIQPIFLQDIINSQKPSFYLEQDMDKQFSESVTQAKQVIQGSVFNSYGYFLAEGLIKKSLDNLTGRIIVLDYKKMIPAGCLSDTDVLYCVQSLPDKKYIVISIGKSDVEGTKELKKPFPKPWAGKKDAELAQITGVSDASFCFKDCLAYAKSLEGAIKLAEIARDYQEN